MSKEETLEQAAIWVIDLYDQANTGGALIKNASNPNRGRILKEAIEDLRAVLNRDQQKTILTAEQAK